MSIAKSIIAIAAAATFSVASAQSPYPSRPITLVLPVSSGSATDSLIRILAERASAMLDVPVVVKNEPGANGVLATQSVIKSSADGYTALAMSTNQVTNSFTYSDLRFDTKNDLKGVVRLVSVPMVLCVNGSRGIDSFPEFLKAARKSASKLNFASAGVGSTGHLSMILLENKADVRFAHIPYKGTNQAQQDLMGGQVDAMFVVPTAANQMVKIGSVKCVAVGSANRINQMPDVPTISEAGVPGFEILAWIGLSMPTDTPDEAASKVSDVFMKIMQEPDVVKRVENMGLTLSAMGHQEFRPYLENEYGVWGSFIKDNNIKVGN